MLKKSGAKTVRWQMQWPQIEPTSGHFNWSVQDKIVGDLAEKGISVLPIMWRTPIWAQSCTTRCSIKPPMSSQSAKDAWQGFLQAAVKRYGPDGEILEAVQTATWQQEAAADQDLGDLERAQPGDRDEPAESPALCEAAEALQGRDQGRGSARGRDVRGPGGPLTSRAEQLRTSSIRPTKRSMRSASRTGLTLRRSTHTRRRSKTCSRDVRSTEGRDAPQR